MHESEPTISRCYFGGNQALQDGGALYLDLGSSPRIIACAYEGNEAGYAGGAARVLASSPLFASSHSFRRFERLSWSSVVREKYHSGG